MKSTNDEFIKMMLTIHEPPESTLIAARDHLSPSRSFEVAEMIGSLFHSIPDDKKATVEDAESERYVLSLNRYQLAWLFLANWQGTPKLTQRFAESYEKETTDEHDEI